MYLWTDGPIKMVKIVIVYDRKKRVNLSRVFYLSAYRNIEVLSYGLTYNSLDAR